ncbi:uncharacterized protein LOC123707403 [Pieris brassicae]|uniref:uncharacterized protein LOC123707403 n=1 Tax=Pieris brassicae TaxID=7116 RepID=UPI001E661726|nr:uncharacterized protein LOC123707403 [Pieris brassicae]
MLLYLNIIFLLLIQTTNQIKFDTNKDLLLTKYTDVFKPGMNGKPQLGSGQATCWARGGVCVHVRNCPSMNFDAAAFGCSQGYKVCCRILQPLSPTVGIQRTNDAPSDLGSSSSEKRDTKTLILLISR